MDFLEAVIVSPFDLICIVGEFVVDGTGYIAWLAYFIVCLFL